jgi:hypothetical protein
MCDIDISFKIKLIFCKLLPSTKTVFQGLGFNMTKTKTLANPSSEYALESEF